MHLCEVTPSGNAFLYCAPPYTLYKKNIPERLNLWAMRFFPCTTFVRYSQYPLFRRIFLILWCVSHPWPTCDWELKKGYHNIYFSHFLFQTGRTPKAVVTHDDIVEKNQMEATKDYLGTLGIDDITIVGNVTKERTALEDQYKKSLLELLVKCVHEGDWMIERMARRVWVRREQHRVEEERRREEERRAEERKRAEREQTAEIARSIAAGIAAGAAAIVGLYLRFKK